MIGHALALLALLPLALAPDALAPDALAPDALAGPPRGAPAGALVASVDSEVAARALATPEPTGRVRIDLQRGLDAIDWPREGVRGPVALHAVLARAESTAERDRSRASCTIRAVVRGADGALLAVVSGSARGEDRPGARASLEREVLLAAANQLTASVPEAVRRARGATR